MNARSEGVAKGLQDVVDAREQIRQDQIKARAEVEYLLDRLARTDRRALRQVA